MKASSIKGISFGITSAIITTLGLMVGLYTGTGSRLAVIGGIITIAFADSVSDALGIHLSEESDKLKNHKEVWAITFSTLATKFSFSVMFIIPVLLFELGKAIIINGIIGFIGLGILSYIIAKMKKNRIIRVMTEHWIIAIVVMIITFYVGKLVSIYF